MAVHTVKNAFPELNFSGNACSPNEYLIGKPVASIRYANGVEIGFWGDSPEDMEELTMLFKEAQKEERDENSRYMQPHIVKYYDFRDPAFAPNRLLK
ncbi:MAG: hypothetical protein ACKPE3_04450 [Sphaerospermopsis kisseleviana]